MGRIAERWTASTPWRVGIPRCFARRAQHEGVPAMGCSSAMTTDISDRYRRVAARFTLRAGEVPDTAWDNPAPCEGWLARDVVRHMVEWMPEFLLSAGGPTLPAGPSVDDDPVGAWI